MELKLNLHETHDRYQHFMKDSQSIDDCVQNLIDQRPFGNHSFYIFVHSRTDDDGFRKRLIYQPRLTKPKAQTNSMLFKWIAGTDSIEVIWMIPVREMWPEYAKGKVTASDIVNYSINMFQHKREELERPDPSDLNDEQIRAIYASIKPARGASSLRLSLPPKKNKNASKIQTDF